MRLNNLQFIILKCSRLLFIYYFCFYFLFMYTQIFLISYFQWLEKGRKKQFRSQPSPWLLKFLLFSNTPPPDCYFLIFFPTTPTISYPLSIRDLSVHTLSAVCDITDESDKLNKNLSVISLELILSFLLCVSLDMETNSFTWLKLHTPISNPKLK